eukprot:CAMPEP_0185780564 /NCGR_PEP_ID=MMETSP1174-20130828/99523_1 /TAXON_ID=35687 /ORGANISM="Dictyocha speculum, Strain CCMP1381" /LENGTH=108 /DNA_ID=CAMNT_0028470179 /DNA_START=213 /DNA_END=539 /DNA_ORIENTATION=-
MNFNVRVRVWLIELADEHGIEDQRAAENARKVRRILLDHGYREAAWDIREYCKQLDPSGPLRRQMTGPLCTANVIFEDPALIIDPLLSKDHRRETEPSLPAVCIAHRR